MKPLHFLPRKDAALAAFHWISWRVLFLMALLANPAFTIPAFAIWDKPSVITYPDWSGEVRIYVFAEGDQHTLVVNFWSDISGSWQWQWADQGVPPGASWITTPSAITYSDAHATQLIDVFAEDSNGHLVVNHWDG